MRPGTAATMPPAMRAAPKPRMWRYSIGLIRRCRPGRGGVSHHLRRRLAAVLRWDAFIGVPPVGCGAGYPITYHCDITLIAVLSMAAVLTGRPRGRHAGPGDLPGGNALVLADQVRAR